MIRKVKTIDNRIVLLLPLLSSQQKRAIACFIIIIRTTFFCVAQSPDPILISPAFTSRPISSQCLIHKGRDFLPYKPASKAWSAIPDQSIRLKGNDAYWIYGILNNAGDLDRTLKLHLHDVQIGEAKLFIITDGVIDSSQITGSLVPPMLRATADRSPSFLINVPSGKVVEIYLRVWRPTFSSTLSLALSDPIRGQESLWVEQLLTTIIGFMFLVLLVSFIFIYNFPYRENLFFLMYILFAVLYVISVTGFGSRYFWGKLPLFEQNSAIVFSLVSAVGFLLFSRYMLKTSQNSPSFDQSLRYFTFIAPVIGIFGFMPRNNFFGEILFPILLFLANIVLVFCLAIILWQSWERAFIERIKPYKWLVLLVMFLLVFVLINLAFEAGLIPFSEGAQVAIIAISVPAQMLTMMAFLMGRVVQVQHEHQDHERQLYKEKSDVSSEKEEQQRFYANLMHEVIKGEAQCILAEADAGSPLKDQLTDFVKTCELGQSFVDKDNNDLYELMKGMEFIFSNRLHSEMNERYFYCEIDPALKSIVLNHQQKYELIFFLRECLNNIRKYAQYKHVGLIIKYNTYNNGIDDRSQHSPTPAVSLEIKDDGIGLQSKFGIAEPKIEINKNNLAEFRQQFLQHHRCTGICELFKKSARLNGDLSIYSFSGLGTTVQLRFFPNSG